PSERNPTGAVLNRTLKPRTVLQHETGRSWPHRRSRRAACDYHRFRTRRRPAGPNLQVDFPRLGALANDTVGGLPHIRICGEVVLHVMIPVITLRFAASRR